MKFQALQASAERQRYGEDMSKNSVGMQMEMILESIKNQIDQISEEDCKKAAQSTKKKLVAYSPGGHNKYKQGWAYKKLDKGYTVYHKTKPGLTHLLNNGHAIVNQNGHYGRTNGDNHMGKAEQEAIQELLDTIQTDINSI